MNKLNISVGICAYNEEKNIYYLLKSITDQKTENVSIEEIVVVCDGSTDKTEEIVRNFPWHGKIEFIKQENRVGKFQAVNEFLKHARSSVLVLASADILLDENAIEQLCLPFISNENMGMTGAHPVPINSADSFLGYVVNLQWYLHHKLSLIRPKFGELIAFKNAIDILPPTFVDEEQIASILDANGYLLKYIPDAIVYNKGPENIRDFILQRRRVYAGHLILMKEYGREVSTLRSSRLLQCLKENLSLEYIKRTHWLISALFLEAIGRILGMLDVVCKKDHYMWKIAESTKALNE